MDHTHKLVQLSPQLVLDIEEADISILPPVRQRIVLEQGHLFDLLEHILVESRLFWILRTIVCDVDVHHVVGFAKISCGVADEAHEEAQVQLGAAECVGMGVAELLDVGDEVSDGGEGDAYRGLVVEEPRKTRVPATGCKKVVFCTP